MPKIYTVRELRDSFAPHPIGKLANWGSHSQGAYYVAAATKADAARRLTNLGFPISASKLRLAGSAENLPLLRERAVFERLRNVGDVVTADRHAGRRLVHIPAGSTEPIVVGTWGVDDSDPTAPVHCRAYVLDTSPEGTKR
ncbi:hypothetical protein K1T35_47430 (plasmid) [Pseudonocardia sp. DSM 110487]|uniref:hypothetical protein n=1 Tax=Pseudonocardia sp. DSM 110487 TaxID=2865833 RepID=UPI001C69AB13|nr:hypothetical protein [Pseudonocardia sp. DSM 110487]QYN40982.1 hypothetical protein K1T35_47430 [Pseudonocardia sp. DSM 110487]